ncbi:TBP family protein [Thermococcus radiotolerans]|uniref:TATA-box-binding protein n=1 Tax=Thermococcus radiotolerans TaxID=187880 RepID=A0A2Z2NBL9_9EURY|nr:hypothetical protein [Thermococcus radiotolerans]ASJ15076.1 hypothetical protein A3L10_08025 [Thermococcus radiotolerans]
MDIEYKIANIVVSGHLGTPLNLESLVTLDNFFYDPEYYHGGYLKLDNGLTVTIYRSGKYIIPGIKRLEDIETSFRGLVKYLAPYIDPSKVQKPQIRNLVISGDFHRTFALETLALKLPNVEYNPEQFPGLIVKLRGSITLLLFSSGRFVIVGAKSLEEVEKAIEKVKTWVLV